MPVSKDNPAWGKIVRYRMRFTWALLATLLLIAMLTGQQPAGLLPIDNWRSVAAITLLLAGLGLRSWAAGVIHKDGILATNGPYSLSRHPLYIGSSLIIIGLGLTWGGMQVALGAALIAALIYWPTLRNEEQVLADAFADKWPDYKRRTAMIGPKKKPQLRANWSAAQWLANDEYELLGIAAIILTGLEIWAH